MNFFIHEKKQLSYLEVYLKKNLKLNIQIFEMLKEFQCHSITLLSTLGGKRNLPFIPTFCQV